jgi:hypothetical protein
VHADGSHVLQQQQHHHHHYGHPRPRRNSLATSDDACWLLFEVEDTGAC